MKLRPVIAYIRVSTQKQGRSGLGLEAQRAANAQFASREGFAISAEFTEVESGKGADALERRPLPPRSPRRDGSGAQLSWRSSIG
jgi:DNA invertase Pin-like site-specific DNA recombinase